MRFPSLKLKSGSVAEFRREVWNRHPGLVWSNPQAGDSVRIRAALLRPQFDRLLDIAIEFGVDRLEEEWKELVGDNSAEVKRATPVVERILRNIHEGFTIAAARD